MALELNTGGGAVFQQIDNGEKSGADTSGRGTRISKGEGGGKPQAVGTSGPVWRSSGGSEGVTRGRGEQL